MRWDAQGARVEGGLARVYTVIKDIRKQDPKALLINTGDTIQGSAEALYTRGQALVDVLNAFGIDAFAPGNWEFVYGTAALHRAVRGPASPRRRGTRIAANVLLRHRRRSRQPVRRQGRPARAAALPHQGGRRREGRHPRPHHRPRPAGGRPRGDQAASIS
ncbi:MAG: hypothetical protein MZW92_39300 [Comamonadaceae bacterium]|nr:hypothetical protein [Comamonadaceae bacterium]